MGNVREQTARKMVLNNGISHRMALGNTTDDLPWVMFLIDRGRIANCLCTVHTRAMVYSELLATFKKILNS